MILQKEIIEKSKEWKVPPDTVDKDYVLGHFLSIFFETYKEDLIFKGGTCLRKCYIENYRFSEDLDFTARYNDFVLEKKTLESIARTITDRTGIQFHVGEISQLVFNDEPKGFQLPIKYWGGNHSKNQQPPPPSRWQTKIKLEVSTDEVLLTEAESLFIMHPYSDELQGEKICPCYSIDEVIAEKLRALKQRSYTAPRDFYDLFHLTQKFSKNDWNRIKPLFLKKMEHKNLEYTSPSDLVDKAKIINVKRAWKTSVAHQITEGHQPDSDEIIAEVENKIKTFLPDEPLQ
jgi:predicted nucleotidyltransferase component of viral defense system